MRKIVEKLIGEKDSFYRKDELEAVLNDVIGKIEENLLMEAISIVENQNVMMRYHQPYTE